MRRLSLIFLLLLWGGDNALAGRVKPKKHYSLDWQEQQGQVVLSSVCAGFVSTSLDYRLCRSYALDHFTALCRQHSDQYKKAGGQRRERERRLKQAYCSAARRLP